ncbi:MAG: dipeptidase [Bacillota bacterium]|jgi:membrane dipeptidase|nr:membrane dipeptidase [Clostridia bacterium]
MIIIDGHCDSLLKVNQESSLYDLGGNSHLDIKRALNRVNLQIFAAYIDSSFKPYQSLHRGLALIEVFQQEIEKYSSLVKPVLTKKDLLTIQNKDILHVLLAVEGGEILCGDILLLNTIFRLGVRCIGLTWNQRNEIADGCSESATQGGLTEFGIKVVKEMNKLGMVIDLAHISPAGFWSVLEHTQSPVMVSHANCHQLCPHRRNLDDAQIKALSQNHGVLGITFVKDFLGEGEVGIEDVLKHIDYAVTIGGVDCVGIGSDFDGTDSLPKGLEDVTKLYLIAEGLDKRGYTGEDIEKIMGRNFLRLFTTILPE